MGMTMEAELHGLRKAKELLEMIYRLLVGHIPEYYSRNCTHGIKKALDDINRDIRTLEQNLGR